MLVNLVQLRKDFITGMATAFLLLRTEKGGFKDEATWIGLPAVPGDVTSSVNYSIMSLCEVDNFFLTTMRTLYEDSTG